MSSSAKTSEDDEPAESPVSEQKEDSLSREAFCKLSFEPDIPHDYSLKAVLVGDEGVTASCLMKRFVGDTFCPVDCLSSFGVDNMLENIKFCGKLITLAIWGLFIVLHSASLSLPCQTSCFLFIFCTTHLTQY